MSRKFNVASDMAGTLQPQSTAYKTALSGTAATATLRRGKISEIAVGPVSNPVTQDCNIFYCVWRQTAADGTSTAATPNVVYVGAQEAGTLPVPGSVWQANYTAEPTYAANGAVWTKALNQHSGFIWYAPDDMGLPWPATNANGLGCRSKGATSDYTGTVLWEVKFEE
jgi:hypothetical protein